MLDFLIFLFAIASLIFVIFLQTLNILFTIFSFKERKQEKKLDNKETSSYFPKVAILLPIYNEDPRFVLRQILYYQTSLKYSNKFLFVIDDSNENYWTPLISYLNQMYKFNIEKCKEYEVYIDSNNKLIIIHRYVRRGFKAGALNTALDFIKKNMPIFEYVAIMDIEWLPEPDFIERCLKEFQNNIAFIQAKRISVSKNKLQRALNIAGDSAYLTNLAGREYFEVPIIFTGSCAIFRYDILEKYRFGENTLTEDLDISIRLYLHGFRGKYAKSICCFGENHPSSFNSFLTQLFRWVYGTTEALRLYLIKVLNSKILKLKEKIVLVYQLSFFLVYFISFSLLILHSILLLLTLTNNISNLFIAAVLTAGPLLFNIPVATFVLDLVNIYIQTVVHPFIKSKIEKAVLPMVTVLAFWAAVPFLFYANLKALLGIRHTWIRTQKGFAINIRRCNINRKIKISLIYLLLFFYVIIIYTIDIAMSGTVMPYHFLWIGAMFFGILAQIFL